jgi:hypothetical protein
VREQVFREPAILRVPLALGLVDEDGARERVRLEPEEGVAREEEPPLHADFEVAQAKAAGSIPRGDLGVHRVAITRRPSGVADLPCGFGIVSNDSVCGHTHLRLLKHGIGGKGCNL